LDRRVETASGVGCRGGFRRNRHNWSLYLTSAGCSRTRRQVGLPRLVVDDPLLPRSAQDCFDRARRRHPPLPGLASNLGSLKRVIGPDP